MSGSASSVLVVEDDVRMRRFLDTSLSAHGFNITEVSTGREAIDAVVRIKPDIILLDLWLPDMDGTKVVTTVRQWSKVPIIIISSRGTEESKIESLDLGADDYITKPFGAGELHARIRAALRHRLGQDGHEPIYHNGDLEVDIVAHEVRVAGQPVKLSPKEFDLLRLFITNTGKVLTHQQILREVWGPGYLEESQYLRVFVGRLRQKLEKEPSRPTRLITEPGIGYRFR